MTDTAEHNRRLIEEFRANRGAPEGRPLLLLTTIGARSGLPRTTPMMYVRVDDRLLVIASNAGAEKHPDWYHNLVANPGVTVEIDDETYPATAVVTEGAERDRLFAKIAERYPFFRGHQAKVARRIPVVALEGRPS
jgi:deazaflavin-dependent oxidoreductase (nitroreductase family)